VGYTGGGVTEEDLLPLSGLQHMSFCERRWALVHIERVWEDNLFTAEGNLLHEKAHSGEIESRPRVLIRRAVPIRSLRLGVSGQADVVEFQPTIPGEPGVALPRRRGLWRPYPIEYKRSKDKSGSQAYRIQLCAQGMCLEEMLGVEVSEGAVFDGGTKRRQPVRFDQSLRESVEMLASRMHALFRSGETPAPIFRKACHACSLKERCFPEALGERRSVSAYYQRFLGEEAN
jgi:CRISPR-associated exonuclease Cas4